MRIKRVLPAKDNILYVISEDRQLIKYDMTDLIENDLDFIELKYYPEKFISARPTNEGRIVSWGDIASVSAKEIEKEGQPTKIGYLEIMDVRQLEEMRKHSDEPIIKKALDNYYGGKVFFGDRDFDEMYDWASDGFAMYYDEIEGDTELSSLYEWMMFCMYWLPEELEKE